ncbi:hypothetical protein Q5P01_005462 [Channa striata]|uniref:Uncharacterized protein n=1 Tax=Channa striata TaxID=64152 RepID=A0AA88NDU2_CHASR|nr:hypothetical protein Q5P01_005462 [Channa striata]
MAESQPQTINAADVAPQGNVPPCVVHLDEKMLHMENAHFFVNQNNELQGDAQAAAKGFPYFNGSGTSLEREVHYVKNAAILAYQQNVHLRSQLHSLLEHNQYLQAEMSKAGNKLQHYDELVNKNTMFYDQFEQLQSENAKILQQNEQLKAEVTTFSLQNKFLKGQNRKIHQRANAERSNVCRLQGISKIRKKDFNAQKQKLQETIAANESQINLLTQHLEMVEEESKFRESTFKEEHSKTAALLSQERKKVAQQQRQIVKASLTNHRNEEKLNKLKQKIDELTVQLCHRDKEILQLKNDVLAFESDAQKLSEITQQLQAKEAENSFIADEWQTKYNCLHVQLTKELSEKNQSWEARFKEVEEEKINLQREKNKLVEENAQLKQEKTEKDKKKLEKEKTLQDKTKLEEEMAEQTKKMTKKKKKGFWSRLHIKKK